MAANKLRTERDETAFICIDSPPRYYPKVVTLDPAATSKLNARIDGMSGIKDSFSCLDAGSLGLKVAFDASWIWGEPNHYAMPANWGRIETAQDLTKWHQAWEDDGSPTDSAIFTPECLENPNLAFFARLSGTTVEAGCIANLSQNVVGMSNVFSKTSKGPSLYSEAKSAVSTFGHGCPVVGYEHGTDLDAAMSAGFQAVGPLRVLVR
jgi:hypothetical protein